MNFYRFLENGSTLPLLMNESGNDGGAGAGSSSDADKKPAVNNGQQQDKAAQNQHPVNQKTAGDDSSFLNDDGEEGGGANDGNQQNDPMASWRDMMAGQDEKFRKHLDRYGSLSDVGKKIRELEKMVGQVKKPLPENPTADQIASWRKENGIPETPEGYEIKLQDGMTLPEEYKPVVSEFLKTMHGVNAPPAIVNSMIGWYMDREETMRAQQIEADKTQRLETIEKLRTELGGEYKATQGMIKAWLDRQGEIGQALLGARGSDGKALFNNTEFVMWLNNHIRETEPSATVIHDAEMSGVSVEDEIKKIQAVIRDDPQKYKTDQKMQDRLAKLVAAKQSRAA